MATTPAPNSEKDEIQSQTQLTRLIEASLKIAIPDPEEIRFRCSLLNCASVKITSLKPAFITRLYEAACDVKFPSDEVTQFRKNLQKVIGTNLGLKQFRKI